MKRLICPLIDYGCRMNTCAWWDGDRGCCSVRSLAADMAVIQKRLIKDNPESADSGEKKKSVKR